MSCLVRLGGSWGGLYAWSGQGVPGGVFMPGQVRGVLGVSMPGQLREFPGGSLCLVWSG